MTDGEPTKAPAPRIGHKERDDAVELLRTAAGDGRITLDELETRVEAALEARTADDISLLVADLPEPAGSAALATIAAQPVRLAVSHGKVERIGAWRVSEEVTVEVRHGVCVLDLRTPALPPSGVRIAVQARHSVLKVLVGKDTEVDLSDIERSHSQTADKRARHIAAVSGPPIVFTGELNHSVVKILRPRRG